MHYRAIFHLFTVAALSAMTSLFAADKPNFILIMADDLGYGDVGYQNGEVPTPNIDSIAKNGIIFTDGYVTCPVCAPSRAGLMTGRYGESNEPPHKELHWIWSGGVRRALREGDIKIVSENGGKSYAMFDLSRDISEENDISSNHPEKLKALIKKHQKWADSLMPQQWGWNKELGNKDPNFGKPRPYHTPGYKFIEL